MKNNPPPKMWGSSGNALWHNAFARFNLWVLKTRKVDCWKVGTALGRMPVEGICVCRFRRNRQIAIQNARFKMQNYLPWLNLIIGGWWELGQRPIRQRWHAPQSVIYFFFLFNKSKGENWELSLGKIFDFDTHSRTRPTGDRPSPRVCARHYWDGVCFWFAFILL